MVADEGAEQLTHWINLAGSDPAARDEVYRSLESRLRRIATRLLRDESSGHLLQETMLVNDAFQQLVTGATNWVSREQFFCAAAKVMRRILVDHARARSAEKRGGGVAPAVLAADAPARNVARPEALVELADLVERLETEHPECFKVFNLHFFMGWELKEIAEEILDLSYATTKRRWNMARAFLKKELEGNR